MDNAYARAYMPLSGWRDDVAVFFPAMSGASIGLFWEKSKPAKKSELLQLDAIYPLLRGLHDAHLLAVLGLLTTRHTEVPKAPFAIAERSTEPIYQTPAWEKLPREYTDGFRSLIAEGGGIHRFSDGSVLHVETLPENFILAPAGWIGILEPPGEAKAPLTMEFALSRFSPELLTQRETQILSLILSGYSNSGISQQLKISVGAVKNHRTRLYKKLDVTTERTLIQLFVQHLTRIENDA